MSKTEAFQDVKKAFLVRQDLTESPKAGAIAAVVRSISRQLTKDQIPRISRTDRLNLGRKTDGRLWAITE
jgi:hypothetical protein